jgi:hypothetical protein
MSERRVAETLHTRATDHDLAAGRQEHSDPPAEPPDQERDRQGEQRDREPEDFGDSWRTYQERPDHIRRTYGWTVPRPPPRNDREDR